MGPWGLIGGGAMTALVVGSVVLLGSESLPPAARSVIAIAVLGAFGIMVAAMVMVTQRWRTSLRSDGEALVLRGPFGASVIPFHDRLRLGRWLDRRHRPVVWVLDGPRPLVRVPGRLKSVRIEAFAALVGLAVVDHDGAPPDADDRDDLDPHRPESSS